jgi:hypothetical protein
MLLVRCGSGVRGIYANHITIWVNAERSCCATSARTDRPTTTGRNGFAPNACRRQPPAVPPYLTPFCFPRANTTNTSRAARQTSRKPREDYESDTTPASPFGGKTTSVWCGARGAN